MDLNCPDCGDDLQFVYSNCRSCGYVPPQGAD